MAASAAEVERALVRLCAEFTERQVPKLPPERALAERLSTSRNTVRRALDALERQGVLRRVRGRAGGAYLAAVTPAPPAPERVPEVGAPRKVVRDLNHPVGVPQMLAAQGFNAGTQVLGAGIETPVPTVATALGLAGGEPVVAVLRLRFADGDTLSLERFYVAARRFPGLLNHRLDRSVYALFESEYGIRVAGCDEAIEATLAPRNVAEALGVDEGVPLLKLTRCAWDADGVAVEHSVDLFRADRTRLTVRTDGPADRVRSGAITATM